MMDNISRDLDVYPTSPVRNYNTLDLIPNPLNEEASSSMGIHVDAILVLYNSVKLIFFLKTNESCSLKRNEPCGQTETYIGLEENDKIETNKKEFKTLV